MPKTTSSSFGHVRAPREQNSDFGVHRNTTYGGTWFENKYPGCACDIPAHVYTYSFQPHTEWSGFYAGSDEIEKYFEKFHDQHKLAPYIRLNTEVLSATWLEDVGECKLIDI